MIVDVHKVRTALTLLEGSNISRLERSFVEEGLRVCEKAAELCTGCKDKNAYHDRETCPMGQDGTTGLQVHFIARVLRNRL